MLNQLDIIENDLKSLQADTKKKYSSIRDVYHCPTFNKFRV